MHVGVLFVFQNCLATKVVLVLEPSMGTLFIFYAGNTMLQWLQALFISHENFFPSLNVFALYL